MKAHTLISDGIKDLKKGEYFKAISKFEDVLILDKNNSDALYYLGLAYIFRNQFDKAYKYLTKAKTITPDDPSILNALSYIQLREGNIEEAINFLLDILDTHPDNLIAKKNLEKIRKTKDLKRLSHISPETYLKFRIKKPIRIPFSRVKHEIKPSPRLLFGIAGVFFIIAFLFLIIKIIPSGNTQKERLKIEDITLPDIKEDYMIDKNIKQKMFEYTSKDLKFLFKECKRLIQKRKYKSAIKTINRILHSNATVIVKERFKILKKFITLDKNEDLEENISYNEVMNLPALYEGGWIHWKVKIIKANDNKFTGLVYEDKEPAGLAEFIMEKPVKLQKNFLVEIKGIFYNIDIKSRRPIIKIKYLEGKSYGNTTDSNI